MRYTQLLVKFTSTWDSKSMKIFLLQNPMEISKGSWAAAESHIKKI